MIYADGSIAASKAIPTDTGGGTIVYQDTRWVNDY